METNEGNTSTLTMQSNTIADDTENTTIVIKIEPDHDEMSEPATDVSPVSDSDSVNNDQDYHKNTKLYECPDCEYSSPELYNYRIHIRRHTGEKPFKCKLCDFCTAHPSALKRHLRIHTGEKPYKCNLCDAKFAQSSPLKRHLITHTGEKPFACDLCDHRSSSASACAKHRKRHFKIKPQPNSNLAATETNSKEQPNSNFEATETISTEQPNSNLAATETNSTKPPNSNLAATETNSTEQPSSNRPYACTLCDYKATYPSYLNQHLLKHSGEKHECHLCYKQFVNSKNLEIHMSKHSKDKILECEQCPFETVHRHSLKQHMLIHNGGKPYACDICDFRTAYGQALKLHFRTHTGEKPYKCNQCDYQTAYPSHLKKHLNKHAGLKPYKCDICDFRCMHPSTLKRHILTHTGERPFHCTQCKFTSTHAGGLKEHMKIHTGEKPYACDKCDFRCSRRSNIKKHSRTHTKVKRVGQQSIKIVDASGPVSNGQGQSKELFNNDIESKHLNYSNSENKPQLTTVKSETILTNTSNFAPLLNTKIKIEPLDYTESRDPLTCNEEQEKIITMHTNEKSNILESQHASKFNLPKQVPSEGKNYKVSNGQTKIKIEPLDYAESMDPLTCYEEKEKIITMHTNEKSNILESQHASKFNLPKQVPSEEKYDKVSNGQILFMQALNMKVDDMFKCDFCDYETQFSNTFKDHVKTHIK